MMYNKIPQRLFTYKCKLKNILKTVKLKNFFFKSVKLYNQIYIACIDIEIFDCYFRGMSHKRQSDDTVAIYIYKRNGDVKAIKARCQHWVGGLLDLVIDGSTFLAQACTECSRICLYNEETRKLVTVYRERGVRLMCLGPKGMNIRCIFSFNIFITMINNLIYV